MRVCVSFSLLRRLYFKLLFVCYAFSYFLSCETEEKEGEEEEVRVTTTATTTTIKRERWKKKKEKEKTETIDDIYMKLIDESRVGGSVSPLHLWQQIDVETTPKEKKKANRRWNQRPCCFFHRRIHLPPHQSQNNPERIPRYPGNPKRYPNEIMSKKEGWGRERKKGKTMKEWERRMDGI